MSFDEEGEVLRVTYRDGTERVFENLKMGPRIFAEPSAKRSAKRSAMTRVNETSDNEPLSEEPRGDWRNWH